MDMDMPRRNRQPSGSGIPIGIGLAAAIGIVVLVALSSLFLTAYSIARLNTYELIHDKAALITESILDHTRGYLDPAMIQLNYLAGLIADGRLDPANGEDMNRALLASLASTPQVSVVAFTDLDLRIRRVFRNRPGHPSDVRDWSDDPETIRYMREDAKRDKGYWGSLFVAEDLGLPYVNARQPVRRNGRFLGSLLAGVSILELSGFLDKLEQGSLFKTFILLGQNSILAHPALIHGYPGLSDVKPLPSLAEFNDPVLRQIWSENRNRNIEQLLGNDIDVRAVRIAGDVYLFLFRYLFERAERPLIVGAYARFDQLAAQVRRLHAILYIGLAVFLAALAMAIVLGGMMARPIRRLSQAARHIRELDIGGAPRLRRGLFRELNEAAVAFNAMVAALGSFETYVPRSLVRRLIRAGGGSAVVSEERDITVMFTDIIGFTALSERMAACDVAALLNQHIAIIDRCVEAEGGTIDKYIGDAVMVFWGAPEAQPDHADRACRAALRIIEEIHVENAHRSLPRSGSKSSRESSSIRASMFMW
jgi:adenylate cyclase